MSEQKYQKLNQLLAWLPDESVVDAATLDQRGYPSNLRAKYLDANWLSSPVRGLFTRPGQILSWQSVVYSMQTLMSKDVLVGGRTALELKGYAHYLELSGAQEVMLYCDTRLPSWLENLPVPGVRFVTHKPDRLFGAGDLARVFEAHRLLHDAGGSSVDLEPFVWGPTGQPILISTLERAVLELLEALPDDQSFHQVDLVFESLTSLRPRRMQALLERCRSVKTKRLFFVFAQRHRHGWLKYLDESKVDLGSGKRSLVKGGTLDTRYLITVPDELAGEGRRGA